MTGREKFSKYKWAINYFVKFYSVFSLKKQKKLLVKHRNDKGIKGLVLRYAILKNISPLCGDNVAIYENVFIYNPENIEFGKNVSINPMCYLEGKGGISIGDDVSIAHGVTIMSSSHSYSDPTVPIKEQPCLTDKVVINNNVWIGAKATILYGKFIGEGSVIGANAVITHNVKAGSIVGGVPARIIKESMLK